MDMASLERRLVSSIQTYDLLSHPFYVAWSAGELTREDLQSYAAQYQHQVDALPALVDAVRSASGDEATRESLKRNLDEELGHIGTPHADLWRQFARELGGESELPQGETTESARRLSQVIGEGALEGLACLWAYEFQTARVSKTKREGLVERYGVTSPAALEFFELHQKLDVLHAGELLSAIGRLVGDDETAMAVAADAASRSAQAQWRFLDGAERVRLN